VRVYIKLILAWLIMLMSCLGSSTESCRSRLCADSMFRLVYTDVKRKDGSFKVNLRDEASEDRNN